MGGEHKCPLCSATFTRPQHVGRHLRAHTGDRPYECKECPLKFARSDLLSRHVNKAHAKPNTNGTGTNGKDKKDDSNKKQRRKSLPNPIINPGMSGPNLPDRKSSVDSNGSGSHVSSSNGARGGSVVGNSTVFQNQRMYPHHPLLHLQNQPNQSQAWSTVAPFSNNGLETSDTGSNFGTLPLTTSVLATDQGYNVPQTYMPAKSTTSFSSVPMKMASSIEGNSAATATNQLGSSLPLPVFAIDYSLKKRACDQCNLSKVRCDFSNPCIRCATRSTPCTYTKQQRSRSQAHSIAFGQSGDSQPGSTSNPAISLSTNYHSSPPLQSMISSPNASSSPNILNSSNSLNFISRLRRNSIAIPPGSAQASSLLTSDALTLGESSQHRPVRPPVPNTPWQQQQPLVAQATDDRNRQATNNYYNTVPRLNVPSIVPPGFSVAPNPYTGIIQGLGGVSATAEMTPSQGIASTPSLSNSTSPSNSDDHGPLERRSSQASRDSVSNIPGAASTVSWSTVPNAGKNSIDATLLPDGTFGLATAFTGSLVNMGQPEMQPMVTTNPTELAHMNKSMNGYQWPTTQTPVSTTAATVPPSAVADETDSTNSAIENQHFFHRRRSSAGVWAHAFNQMTLQDPANSIIDSTAIPLNAVIPPTQLVQQFQPAAMSSSQAFSQPQSLQPAENSSFTVPDTSFATTSGFGGTSAEPLPSLSDVKDLWRLFMNEPITGPTPAAGKQNEIDPMSLINAATNNSVGTPKTENDHRGLLKSRSMPDLNSPILGAVSSPPKNNALGATPKPMINQSSYLPIPQLVDQTNAGDGIGSTVTPSSADHSAALWNQEIQQRLSKFSIAPAAKMRVKAINSSSNAPFSKQSSNASGDSNNANVAPSSTATENAHQTPMRSMVQPSVAMLQTLAPERTPSFGLNTTSLDSQDPLNPTPMVPTKLSAVVSRPGNKRLPSRTLVPELNKKQAVPTYLSTAPNLYASWDESTGSSVKPATEHVYLGATNLPGPEYGAAPAGLSPTSRM